MNLFLEPSFASELRAEVLIVGAGIAGLSAAITLKTLGIEPVLIYWERESSVYSQGGIACATKRGDSPQLHLLDTLRAGRGLCDERAVRVLVEEGIREIAKLESYGLKFDEKSTKEGGHSFERILRVGDFTGREVVKTLKKKVEELKIGIFKLKAQEIIHDGRILGILAIDENKSVILIVAKAVILASGGYSAIFSGSSNPEGARGDIIGASLRAGLELKNMEFVQFHPTLLESSKFLLTEALRGEGAILIDEDGERFVDELLPRDVVARSIYKKIKAGKRVFLDLKRVKDLPERFPTIFNHLLSLGLKIKEPVPVVPGAHFSIGGISVDLWGRTQIEGLYAIGECACNGVHGANRLASNALLEGLVFGSRAGYAIYHDIKGAEFKGVKVFSRRRRGLCNPEFTKKELSKLVFELCGLERDESGLKEALNKLNTWLEASELWERTPENRELLDECLVAKAMVESALWRKESRGVHFRSDFSFEREEFRKDSHYRLYLA